MFKVVFHPKKPLVVTASDDNDIRVWDLDKRHSIKILKVDEESDQRPSNPCKQHLGNNILVTATIMS